MNSLKDVRTHVGSNGVAWVAVADLAKKIGRTSDSLIKQSKKLSIELSSCDWETKLGKRILKMIQEKDVFGLLASLRITGEFADSFKQIHDTVMAKGLEQVAKQIEQPKRIVKPFQRFPEPIPIPEKSIRASVNEYIRMVFKITGKPCNVLFNELYTEFKYRFGIDPLRHSGYPSSIAKVEDLEKMQELYSLARHMFDPYLPEENPDVPKLEA